MSFVYKSAERNKSSSARRYRVSRVPYTSSSQSKAPSFLLSESASVSGRAFDKRSKNLQDTYEASLKDYNSAQRKDLEDVREEIGWAGSSTQVKEGNPGHSDDTLDSDDDWVDEEPFHYISGSTTKHANLSQSWSERLAKEKYAWEREMSTICDEFLAYSRTGPPNPVSPSTDTANPPSVKVFSLLCIRLTSKEKASFVLNDSTSSPLRTLVRHGYIPPTPSAPSLAIHVDVLKYCAALRRHASIVSLQSLTSAICEVHNIPYARHFRTQLSAALDVYLAIMRMVDLRLAKFLSRDDPDWRMANACAACTYRLKDEPSLEHSILLTCDGNDSQKRVASASVVDSRVFNHSYFLDNDYVDRFENEVRGKAKVTKNKAGQAEPSSSTQLDPVIDADANHGAGDMPTRKAGIESVISPCGEEEDKPCEQRWKNARADETSGKKLVVFDETGIFVVSCRHGTVILVEDMRQSGELSKYGLAAVDTLARVFGKNILIGYDIGCTFRITALRSPLVGPLVRELLIKFVVGSFHGYAHQRKCQLSNHPMHVKGAGLESFEQNEQLFSSTNDVARTTRHASSFHRRQLLALHLSAWDEDRWRNLGSVLKARYVQALDVLATLPREIEKLCPNKTDDDWCAMFEAERKYFDTLQVPNPESAFSMFYLKRLRNLSEKQDAFNKVFESSAEHTSPAEIKRNGEKYYHVQATRTRKIEAQRAAASEQLATAQVEVAAIEQEHGIYPRWTPGCPEWEAATEREAHDHYYETLRDLELLVVQRIAELEKTHMMGTGYNTRKEINKAVNQREKAIHGALDRYNNAARALNPPRRTLAFKELTECAYMADFDLLKYSEHGALDAEWAQPAHRRCVVAWHKIERAKEEITRLNVEIRRVRTHMHDEEQSLSRHLQLLHSTNPDLAHFLLQRLQLAFQINRHILRDLEAISNLKGFSGDLSCGVRVDLDVSAPQPESLPASGAPNTIVDALKQLALEEDISPAADAEEAELSDEVLRVLTSVEDCCKVM